MSKVICLSGSIQYSRLALTHAASGEAAAVDAAAGRVVALADCMLRVTSSLRVPRLSSALEYVFVPGLFYGLHREAYFAAALERLRLHSNAELTGVAAAQRELEAADAAVGAEEALPIKRSHHSKINVRTPHHSTPQNSTSTQAILT